MNASVGIARLARDMFAGIACATFLMIQETFAAKPAGGNTMAADDTNCPGDASCVADTMFYQGPCQKCKTLVQPDIAQARIDALARDHTEATFRDDITTEQIIRGIHDGYDSIKLGEEFQSYKWLAATRLSEQQREIESLRSQLDNDRTIRKNRDCKWVRSEKKGVHMECVSTTCAEHEASRKWNEVANGTQATEDALPRRFLNSFGTFPSSDDETCLLVMEYTKKVSQNLVTWSLRQGLSPADVRHVLDGTLGYDIALAGVRHQKDAKEEGK